MKNGRSGVGASGVRRLRAISRLLSRTLSTSVSIRATDCRMKWTDCCSSSGAICSSVWACSLIAASGDFISWVMFETNSSCRRE